MHKTTHLPFKGLTRTATFTEAISVSLLKKQNVKANYFKAVSGRKLFYITTHSHIFGKRDIIYKVL